MALKCVFQDVEHAEIIRGDKDRIVRGRDRLAWERGTREMEREPMIATYSE